MVRVDKLTPAAYEAALDRLAEILVDAVDGGASVTFMPGLGRAAARRFFADLVPAVQAERAIVLAGFADDALVGTVQLHLAWQPNQPHRADVAKLLVHRSARRRGVGQALMARLEAVARAHGRTLLTFDTVPGSDAERLYLRLGYARAGVIPGYALLPSGALGDAAFFYKAL